MWPAKRLYTNRLLKACFKPAAAACSWAKIGHWTSKTVLVVLTTAGNHEAEIEASLSLMDHVGLLGLPSALPYFCFCGHCLLGSLLSYLLTYYQPSGLLWWGGSKASTKKGCSVPLRPTVAGLSTEHARSYLMYHLCAWVKATEKKVPCRK